MGEGTCEGWRKQDGKTDHPIPRLLSDRGCPRLRVRPEEPQYLTWHFGIDVNAYDLVMGYRADDSYFAFAEAFLNNTITV